MGTAQQAEGTAWGKAQKAERAWLEWPRSRYVGWGGGGGNSGAGGADNAEHCGEKGTLLGMLAWEQEEKHPSGSRNALQGGRVVHGAGGNWEPFGRVLLSEPQSVKGVV